MNEFLDAIEATLIDSDLYNAVGGRCFLDICTSPDFPNVVYSAFGSPERTFSEHYYNIMIQFSLRSTKSLGKTSINNLYTYLLALFDEKPLTISGYNLIWMRESNMIQSTENPESLPDGSDIIINRTVDFDVLISKV